jgi:hypothetical protein
MSIEFVGNVSFLFKFYKDKKIGGCETFALVVLQCYVPVTKIKIHYKHKPTILDITFL